MKNTKVITEIAVAVALSVCFHFIRLFAMPQGGDVSLTMIPIIFIAYRRGAFAGITAGVLYGIINIMLDGTIYHPMSIFLDYLFAFGVLGVAGFFKKSLSGIISGTILSVGGRFIFSFLSGAILFGSYAPEGQSPWVYSLIYQATYLVPELIICLIVMVITFTKGKRLFDKA